jgi:hypothetical protein
MKSCRLSFNCWEIVVDGWPINSSHKCHCFKCNILHVGWKWLKRVFFCLFFVSSYPIMKCGCFRTFRVILLRCNVTGSLWCRQSQQSFNALTPFNFFFTHYMFRPLRAILRWDIQLVIWRTILIQRICCTYAILI